MQRNVLTSKFKTSNFNVEFTAPLRKTMSGTDPEFWLGGGGGAQKIMCAHAHHEREARSPLFTAGVQGPLKSPDSSQAFDALSYYLSLIC